MKKFSDDLEFSDLVLELVKISSITVFISIALKISYVMALRSSGLNHHLLVAFFIVTLALYGVYIYKKFSE